MKLPNAESAFIPKEKLTQYLLSETHPVGRAKAAFFRTAGYNDSTVSLLEARLLELARANEVTQVNETNRGTKFVIEGEITTPSRRSVRLRTVWIIEPHEPRPRFVTAYPHE